MSKAIFITSGKGGVGKTFITAMLSMELSKLGNKTIALDYDTGLRNLDMALGMQSIVVFDIVDYFNKKAKLDDVIITGNDENLNFIPNSQYSKQRDIEPKDMEKLIKTLKESYDYILLDSPAGVEKSVKRALKLTDMNILVVTADNVSIRDAEKIIFEINKRQLPRPQVIVNKVNEKLVRQGYMYSPKMVANILDVPLLGYVPDDIYVTAAINNTGYPQEDTPAILALRSIAQRLNGKDIPIKDISKPRFFDRFRKKL